MQTIRQANKKLGSTRKVLQCKGQSITEVVAGLLIFIPIVLALIDMGMVLAAGNLAHTLAFQGARAIASLQPNDGTINTQLSSIWKQAPSAMFTSGALTFSYDNATNPTMVQVLAKGNIKLPVPLPFVGTSSVPFNTSAEVPMVSIAPSQSSS